MEPKIYNPEDIKPFGGGDYESRLLLDNLMAGEKAVNVNHGTVCPGGGTGKVGDKGGVHEKGEVYFGVSGEADVYLDGVPYLMKQGTLIYIPGGCYHFIVNRSKTESYAIGAQGIDAINEAYPVPPLENVDANFQAMAAATPDFTAVCDGQPAACCANISLYNANSQSFSDVESLPPQGSAYIVLMLMVPKDWKQLKVTYVPTFLEGKSLTFVMNASNVIRS